MTQNREHDHSCFYVKDCACYSNKCPPGVLLGDIATQEAYRNLLRFIPYRPAAIVLKRRNVESDESIRAKWEPSKLSHSTVLRLNCT